MESGASRNVIPKWTPLQFHAVFETLARDDAPDTLETPNGRDDKQWLKHTLWYREGNRLSDYKPVQMKPLSVDTIELKKRAY